jgi:hypothetical protein
MRLTQWLCNNSRVKKVHLFGLFFIVGITTFRLSKDLWTHHAPILFDASSRFTVPTTHSKVLRFQDGEFISIVSSQKYHVFDIVSVGTIIRPDYQDAQQKSFGSHPSVRHFFRITEDDDMDQACHQNLTNEEAYSIARYCRSKQWDKHQSLLQHLKNHFAVPSWLKEKANPAGWICAQRRLVHGFFKAIQSYQTKKGTLPDYLVIMDDDTYYNMELVSTFLNTTRQPLSIAGCLVRHPMYQFNFTFPFGGWGLIYNQGALENLMRPIRCRENGGGDDFLLGCCQALKDDQIGESKVFREGMSLSDLMQAYASWQPFSKFREWSTGYCLHADWMFGYFTNFYPVSARDPNPYFKEVSHARLVGYNGSEIYGRKNLANRKQCNNANEKCTRESHICHYQSPQMMQQLSISGKNDSRVSSVF